MVNARSDKPDRQALPQGPSAMVSATRTLLVVEDHGALQAALCDWLGTSFPNCETIAVASGEEALALCETTMPVVTLMDVDLPGINGIETTRQLVA